MFAEILRRVLREGVERLLAGTMPQLMKGGFYSVLTVLAIMSTNYLSSVEKRFSEVQTSLASNPELNRNMAIIVERSQGQQRILELHGTAISEVVSRVKRLEAEKPQVKSKEKK